MIIRFKSDGKGFTLPVDHNIDIELNSRDSFKIREEVDKIRISANDGFLHLEPISSNVILIEQKDGTWP